MEELVFLSSEELDTDELVFFSSDELNTDEPVLPNADELMIVGVELLADAVLAEEAVFCDIDEFSAEVSVLSVDDVLSVNVGIFLDFSDVVFPQPEKSNVLHKAAEERKSDVILFT